MGITALGRFDEFVDNMLRRRLVRIPHPEIYDVLATCTCRRLQLIDDIENIGW